MIIEELLMMIDDNWRIVDYCCWWLCTVLWLMSIDLQECGISRGKIGFLRIFWTRCQKCVTKMWYRSNKQDVICQQKYVAKKRMTAKTGMNLKQLWNRKNGCHQVSPFITGTQAWYQICPHRRCWGVIFQMALAKGYRFTWGGGGIIRAKTSCFW